MAANMAPTTSVNAITSSTSTSTSSTFNTCSENNSCAVADADATNDVYNNFHELCRSCGKTNEELYDLFQTTIGWNTTASSASTAMTASPFNTSSTTCYTHLNTSTSNMPQPSSSSSLSSSSKATTFDSVAATAKATAKGQSNMENILQEMQIWHLQIQCNDGLPQRICAKCTAQFYMIHKFRRKCLKVQTQLRGLYEEEKMLQQAAAQVNERQQQQQPTEKDTKITIVPTSTPATAPPATFEAEVPTPPNSLTMDHDLINDNYGKTQALSQKSTSVNFERNTWNANDGATLPDNVVKTMAKTEANEPTPTILAAYGKQIQDEKAPQLLLNTEKPSTSTSLTLKNHKEQKCDNERKNLKKSRTKSTSSAKGKLCIDQEELLATHIIYKSNCDDSKQDELIQSKDDMEDCQETSTTTATDCEQNSAEEDIFKLRHINDEITKTKDKEEEEEEEEEETEEYTEHCITEPGYKANLEGLFITKAALKAYTISQTKTPSAYDNSECSASTTSNASITSFALSSQETPDVTQLVCANLKQTIPSEPATTLPTTIHKTAADSGIQQVLATVNKIANDDNNNDHNTDHHHNDSQHSTGHTNFSSSSLTFSSSSFAKKSKLVKTEVRLKRRKSFVKRAGRRKTKVANKKRGHRYKLNAKMPTLRRRALFTYRTTSSSSSSATSSPQSSNKQKSQHELKRLQDNRTCSSTSVKQHQKQLKVVEQYRLKNNIATKSTYEIETKIEQKININNRNLKEKAEKLETPAIIMEDESSSTSTTLPATTASSSSMKIAASSATTPAVTDLVKPLKEKHEINSYATNANAIKRRRQQSPLSKSSRGGNTTTTTAATASATSTTLWKTKAAMKANANDMHMDMDVKQQQKDNEHLTNDIKETILLPHKAVATTTCNIKDSATTTPTTLCLNLATILKTHNEKPSNCHTMEKNLGNNSKTVLSSKDHKVKDIKSTIQQQQQQQQKYLNNLRPEEADQKQIKLNINKDKDKDKGKSEQTGETENVPNLQQETTEAKEFINHNNPLQQKPISTSSTATTDSTALTPSAKNGCMKLIIQRKRGARFKCRRKDDETQQDILPKKRKLNSKKLETKLEMESLFSLDLNGDYSKEDKELIEDSLRHMEEITNDSDILENIKEQMGINEKINKENYEEKSTKKKSPSQQKRNFDMMSKIKTNRLEQNSDGYETENSIINLTQDECKELEDPLELDCLDYRDQNSCTNERNEEDDEDDEEDITNNYELNDNIPQQFKLSKENLKLENVDYADRPKKLIIRVPLASLTQDFKRLHLSMQQEGNNKENSLQASTAQQEELNISNTQELENSNLVASSAPPSFYKELNTLPLSGSSQSDLLGFSQSSVSSENSLASSQKSVEQMRLSNHSLCAASSKINDFINDFQNNCIDSSEIDDVNNEILPILPNASKELSDEIRDVEDTLNGILSEMHDKDMYTPRSVDQEDLFPHSVYSPLTDAPTTPSQSFYAESPCTMNGNPMSVSPFIHQGMDYNAMTPQSNHSSMGPNSHMSSSCGGNSNNPNVYSGHFPTYNECYEETTQSELIAFQNDIPCFENIELTNPPSPSELIATTDLSEVINEEPPIIPLKAANNSVSQGALNKNDIKTNDQQIVDYVDLCQDYPESNETKETPSMRVPVNNQNTELVANPAAYNSNNYQAGLLDNNPIQTGNSLLTATPNSHYIVTNTAQGPVLIANPHVNTGHEQIDAAFKAHNNLQFVTLGQALEANKTQHPTAAHLLNNSTPDINWSSQSNATQQQQFTQQQQPVIPTANPATTTYFINAGGEVYRASVPTPSLQSSNVNSLIVPPPAAQQQQSQTHNVAFSKSSIDANENYLQTLQQHTQQQHHPNHQQQQQYPIPQLSPQTSQYIMVVNNLGTTPQYYATQANQTTAMASPTVLFQPASVQNSLPTLNNQCNFINNSNLTPSVTPEISRPTPTNTPNITPPILASPKTPSVSPSPSQQTMHQRVNQQLQQQIKQRQLQLLQPRSPNCTQKINLICRFCHKRPKFTNNVDYSNHIINMHPAEKPYNCPHCSMHFTRRFERQHHVAQVHGSRYQCAQCGLSFCAQRTLDFHLQKYHANLGRSYQQQQTATSSSSSSSSSSPVNQQQNSSSSSATATYKLLQHNQQQRLVRVEDVHVQVTGESKNKRSIDLQLDDADINASQSNTEVETLSATTQQQTRKLCCPDCNGDNDDCCASKKHQDHNNHQPISQQQEQQEYTGNESVKHHHITIPSPEQTEPDSTTTLRHFRKRQLSEMSPFFSSSSTSSSFNNSNDNVVVCGDGSSGGGEQIVVERTLRGSHNCLFCEESFTNEIALRKHHHLAHGTQATMPFVCTVCKRGFRMRTALQRHMETHDAEGRPYECNICQVRFPRPSQLTLHKLTVHKFEKPHSCEECGKQFGTESAMKAHAKVHEDATATTTTTSQLTSSMYVDTATIKEENVNLQTTTSGEIATIDSSPLDTDNDVLNTSETNIVSEPTT